MNDPPTAVDVIPCARRRLFGRRGMNDPPTAVGGIPCIGRLQREFASRRASSDSLSLVARSGKECIRLITSSEECSDVKDRLLR
jgi:hypothetical protein